SPARALPDGRPAPCEGPPPGASGPAPRFPPQQAHAASAPPALRPP
ncbi:MAG: hydrogenase expression protein, partial [Gemmatimonadaceae bacterium]|nr:hydrogenase expression protein [Gemmatimonadaceae bacterium]